MFDAIFGGNERRLKLGRVSIVSRSTLSSSLSPTAAPKTLMKPNVENEMPFKSNT